MVKSKKIVLGLILSCLLCFLGIYEYKSINEKNIFTISQVNWSGKT